MKRFAIIHLSDLHYDNSSDFKDIWGKFIEDLRTVTINSGIEKIALLTITGDLVDKGQIDLYKGMNEAISQIKREFGITKSNVLTIPGNHDVNTANEALKVILKNKNADKIISNDWPTYFTKFNDFSFSVGKNKKSYFVTVMKLNGVKLRIIGFNTAWSIMLNKRFGEMRIGDKQFVDLENELNNSISKDGKCDYTIAMMHHPLDWLAYDERERLLHLFKKAEVNALMHGHVHESFVEEITDIDTSLTVLCTGWSYRKGENQHLTKDSMMRYAIYDFDFNTRTINVFNRVTNREQRKFIGDSFLYSCADSNGFFSIPLDNPNNALFPVFAAPGVNDKRIDKPYFFLSKSFFSSFLKTEENIFILSQRMEAVIDDFCNMRTMKYWLDSEGKQMLCEEYVDYSLGTLCYTILLEMASLFSLDEKRIRMMFRQYDPESDMHKYYISYGEDDNPNEHRVQDFKWHEGMIYKSYEQRRPLLKSANRDYHKAGKTNKWEDYLTMTIETVISSKPNIPEFSFNIAIASPDLYEFLLELSLSSFYYSINQMFDRCNKRVRKSIEEYKNLR